MNYLLAVLALVGFVITVGSSPTTSVEEVGIVGGEEINITEAPYQVSLQQQETYLCGGTIISKDIIITAAHCVYGRKAFDLRVRAGTSSRENGGVVVSVRDLIYHPDYTHKTPDGDVGILWLAQPLTFSNSVSPVDLYGAGEEIKDGELLIVTGWGRIKENGPPSDVLRRVSVHKTNHELCYDYYKDSIVKITAKMLCAGEKDGGKDSCQGDSGGPLIHNGKLAGVVSWGDGCARAGKPGVYAKISVLRYWLDEQIKNHQ